MDLMSVAQGYLLMALALALTTYITIWRTACVIIRIELEDEAGRFYKGIPGFITWIIVATVLAPGVLFLILVEDNLDLSMNLADNVINRRTE